MSVEMVVARTLHHGSLARRLCRSAGMPRDVLASHARTRRRKRKSSWLGYLRYITLHYTILYFTIPHSTAVYHIISHYTILDYLTYHTIP